MMGECPKCGAMLSMKIWRDDTGIVETYKKCHDCGWTYHWSYGSVVESEDDEDEA